MPAGTRPTPTVVLLSLILIPELTSPYSISYAAFCFTKKNHYDTFFVLLSRHFLALFILLHYKPASFLLFLFVSFSSCFFLFCPADPPVHASYVLWRRQMFISDSIIGVIIYLYLNCYCYACLNVHFVFSALFNYLCCIPTCL